MGGEVHKVTCQIRKLDEMFAEGAIPFPALLNASLRCAELRIFRGAETILNRVDSPVLLFEVNAMAANSLD
jgi:hypothetical protein